MSDPTPKVIPSGKHTKSYGKSQFLMGKSTISMAIFQDGSAPTSATISFGDVLDKVLGTCWNGDAFGGWDGGPQRGP